MYRTPVLIQSSSIKKAAEAAFVYILAFYPFLA